MNLSRVGDDLEGDSGVRVAIAEIALTGPELVELGEAAPRRRAATGDRYPAGQMSTLTQRATRPSYLIGEPFHG